MQRTNIYLTDEQQKRLHHRAQQTGESKSELIRQMLDEALEITHPSLSIKEAIQATSGIWADRDETEIENVLAWRREVPLERLAR